MNEEVAYNITKSIMENKDALLLAHSFFRDLAPENILNVVAPLHPGAERYFREIGILN